MADALINATNAGNTTLVNAPGGNQFIRVYHYHFTSDRPTTVELLSGTGTVKDVCYATNASGGGISTPEYVNGIFDCNVGDALLINLSATANVGGGLKYEVKGQPL